PIGVDLVEDDVEGIAGAAADIEDEATRLVGERAARILADGRLEDPLGSPTDCEFDEDGIALVAALRSGYRLAEGQVRIGHRECSFFTRPVTTAFRLIAAADVSRASTAATIRNDGSRASGPFAACARGAQALQGARPPAPVGGQLGEHDERDGEQEDKAQGT